MNLAENFKIDQYDVEVWTRGDNIQIHIYNADLTHIGEFIWYNEQGKWKTESVALAPEAQGKGIAFKIYVHAIENYMHTLYSDTSLTGETGKGSFDVWVKLGNHFQYKYVYNVDEDMLEEVSGFTRELMGDENVLFVVSVEDIIEP
jgi:GNAT superfamily N-acetyltransferase